MDQVSAVSPVFRLCFSAYKNASLKIGGDILKSCWKSEIERLIWMPLHLCWKQEFHMVKMANPFDLKETRT